MKAGQLTSFEDALTRVLALAKPLNSEPASIAQALGRAVAEPVKALKTLPPWANSAMDGYAVRSADCVTPGAQLTVVETIFAGAVPQRELKAGQCARIMTGAQLPPGADAVVMQEKTRKHSESLMEMADAVPPGQFVRAAGEDVKAGETLLPAGGLVGLAEAGALWAQGLLQVPLIRRPTVAIAACGDELCSVEAPVEGKLVDTNAPLLSLAVERLGGSVQRLGIARDELQSAINTFRPGLAADVLITIAGASVGERDFTKEALEQLGVSMNFWRLAIKPGKPLAVGVRENTVVFGLPGNPVSAMVTFELFVKPFLRAVQGLPSAAATVRGALTHDFKKPAGLRHFVRAAGAHDGAQWRFTALPNQSSGALSSARGATHLLSVAPDTTELKAGALVEAIALDWL